MSPYVIEWAALSDTGRQREHNEDAFLADDTEGLWVVCDGMGGHYGGEEASVIAVEAVHHFLAEMRYDPPTSNRFPRDTTLPPIAADLVAGIQYANERIFIESVKSPEKQGMGTTCVAVLRAEDKLVVAHVGDSRVYRFRGGRLQQITADHSLINHLLANGQLTPEQVAAGMAPSNVILRALGLKQDVPVDAQIVDMADGDIYLLCSDGLSDMIDDQLIAQVLAGFGESLSPAAQQLVHLANAHGGKDNITALLLKTYSDEQPMVVI